MNLLELVQTTIAREPTRMLLAGRCVLEDGCFTLYPKPDSEDYAVLVFQKDVVDGPIEAQCRLPPDIDAVVQVLKVEQGTRILVRQRDREDREVVLRPQQGREGIVALSNPPERGTCCRLLLEFDCATGIYKGWCFGWWNCLWPGSKC